MDSQKRSSQANVNDEADLPGAVAKSIFQLGSPNLKELAEKNPKVYETFFHFFENSSELMGIFEVSGNQVHFLSGNKNLRSEFAKESSLPKLIQPIKPEWRERLERCQKFQEVLQFDVDDGLRDHVRRSFHCTLTSLSPQGESLSATYAILLCEFTEQKRLEEIMEEQKAKLVHASKMASLGEMASGIAHEVNNPLATIQGAIQVLKLQMQTGTFTPESFREKTERIEATVARIAKIVSSLRSFSRDGRQDPVEACSLQKIIQDTLELCQYRFVNQGIELHWHVGEDYQVMCRPVQISQVLLNVLNNAFDAVAGLPEKWVSMQLLNKEKEIQILIQDSGPGIPLSIQEKMMSPFFTTKQAGRGTGLGLSLSKSLIESHGGRLEYDATATNTTFVITLPIH